LGSVLVLSKPSWNIVPAGNWADPDGCFDNLSMDDCVGLNVPEDKKHYSARNVKCLWCTSVSNSTSLYHPDHCAPLSAVKSGAYAHDQMVCAYRQPNHRHKPGQFFQTEHGGAKHHHKEDHKNGHKESKHDHKEHKNGHKQWRDVVPRFWRKHAGHGQGNEHAGDWNHHGNEHRGPGPQHHPQGHSQHGGKQYQWRDSHLWNGRRHLLEALTVEDPYSGGGGGDSPDSENPLGNAPPGLQFLAGLALGLLGETPSNVVMCAADVSDIVEDISDAFSQFHLSVSGVLDCLKDLFNAIKDFSEALKNCGLEDVLEKITSFLEKYTTPVIGEIIGAVTITFNAINVYDDIDDAVHSSQSGNWFEVGKDVGDVISIVA